MEEWSWNLLTCTVREFFRSPSTCFYILSFETLLSLSLSFLHILILLQYLSKHPYSTSPVHPLHYLSPHFLSPLSLSLQSQYNISPHALFILFSHPPFIMFSSTNSFQYQADFTFPLHLYSVLSLLLLLLPVLLRW